VGFLIFADERSSEEISDIQIHQYRLFVTGFALQVQWELGWEYHHYRRSFVDMSSMSRRVLMGCRKQHSPILSAQPDDLAQSLQ
jgi:hypothetical protein